MIFYHITFLSILCSCVYVYGHVCVLACMGSSKDNLSERALFSHHGASGVKLSLSGLTSLFLLATPSCPCSNILVINRTQFSMTNFNCTTA